MMGNLAPGLKSHAVTMYEVGKTADETLDDFLNELDKVHILCKLTNRFMKLQKEKRNDIMTTQLRCDKLFDFYDIIQNLQFTMQMEE